MKSSREKSGREIVIAAGKGLKHDKGKLMWGLLPWMELKAVVEVLTFGAKKYKPNNWRKVENGRQRYFDAAMRHISAIGAGEVSDPETGINHYAHAICSLLFSFWHSKKDRKTRANDDGPSYE